ncbi:hypothetical protein F4561_006524 [Lipingzhangella halophila]|uniref:Uncharacterized protein n=1 Tax=Lipingzhangella halophila TaxID=1783352 RepID=A0A7W7RP83_9ACTN|nr:hypothetical protein [Lipingzhangella halophila]MBB4935630.1 hypothetical protein [Lipingzhangella halophila]
MSLRRFASTAAMALALGLLAAGNSGTALADTQEEPAPREPAQESGQEAAQEGGEGTAQEESTTVTYGPWTIPAAEGDHEGGDGSGEDGGHEHAEEGAATAAGGLGGWPGSGDEEDEHAHHGQEGGIELNIDKPCEDCFITGFTPKMTYEDGTEAHVNEGPMLHHYVIFNSSARDAVCPGSERKLSSGNERISTDFPEGYGMKIEDRERWHMNYDLMNMDPAEAKDVNIEIDFTYVDASEAGDMQPLTPLWLDVGGCFGSAYDIPEGDTTDSNTWTSDVSGDLVHSRGHLHHGGHSLWTENTTQGTELCHITAEEGGSPEFIDMEGHGQISDMPPCSGELGRVEEGDVLETSARYVVEGHSHTGVMGIMVGYLAED